MLQKYFTVFCSYKRVSYNIMSNFFTIIRKFMMIVKWKNSSLLSNYYWVFSFENYQFFDLIYTCYIYPTFNNFLIFRVKSYICPQIWVTVSLLFQKIVACGRGRLCSKNIHYSTLSCGGKHDHEFASRKRRSCILREAYNNQLLTASSLLIAQRYIS